MYCSQCGRSILGIHFSWLLSTCSLHSQFSWFLQFPGLGCDLDYTSYLLWWKYMFGFLLPHLPPFQEMFAVLSILLHSTFKYYWSSPSPLSLLGACETYVIDPHCLVVSNVRERRQNDTFWNPLGEHDVRYGSWNIKHMQSLIALISTMINNN